MKKIAIFDHGYRVNPKSTCGGFVKEAFERAGYQVIMNKFDKADMALVIRGEHEPLSRIFDLYPKVALWYWEPPFWDWFDRTADLFREHNSHIFLSCQGSVRAFKETYGNYKKVHFLPQAFNPKVHKPIYEPKIEKKYDIVYIGSASPERSELLGKLQREFPACNFLICGKGYGLEAYNEDFSEIVGLGKICLELPQNTSPNWQKTNYTTYSVRNFMYIGCGGYMISPYNKDFMGLWKDYRLPTYKNYKELVKAIQDSLDYWNMLKDSELMLEQGLTYHTYDERVKKLLEVLND